MRREQCSFVLFAGQAVWNLLFLSALPSFCLIIFLIKPPNPQCSQSSGGGYRYHHYFGCISDDQFRYWTRHWDLGDELYTDSCLRQVSDRRRNEIPSRIVFPYQYSTGNRGRRVRYGQQSWSGQCHLIQFR